MKVKVRVNLINALNDMSNVTATDRGEYIRVAHPFKGVTASIKQDKIEAVATIYGYNYKKVRDFGNGMIQCCTYEIQLREGRFTV